MGIGAPMDDDDDEDSLLAELAALEGKNPGKQKAKPQKSIISSIFNMRIYIKFNSSMIFLLLI